MSKACLRPYLGLVSIFRYLPRKIQLDVAAHLVSKQIEQAQVIDLRGESSQVLCIATEGIVQVEIVSEDGRINKTILHPGQHTDIRFLLGLRRTHLVRLSAGTSNTKALFLWRRSLITVEPLRMPVMFFSSLLEQAAHFADVSRRLSSSLVQRASQFLHLMFNFPIVTGICAGVLLTILMLSFLPLGRSLLADAISVWAIRGSNVAFADLSRVLRLDSNHITARLFLGNIAMDSQQWSVAGRHYLAAANVDGASANNLGILLLRQSAHEVALDALLKSKEIDADVALVHQNLGIAYLFLGQNDQAIYSFKEALRIDPYLSVSRYHSGMDYLRRNAVIEAGSEFARIIETDPHCAPAYLGLGLVEMKIGNWANAAIAFRQASALDPESIPAHFYWEWASLEANLISDAETALSELIILNPPADLVSRAQLLLDGTRNSK